jgi:hypothetical protein
MTAMIHRAETPGGGYGGGGVIHPSNLKKVGLVGQIIGTRRANSGDMRKIQPNVLTAR